MKINKKKLVIFVILIVVLLVLGSISILARPCEPGEDCGCDTHTTPCPPSGASGRTPTCGPGDGCKSGCNDPDCPPRSSSLRSWIPTENGVYPITARVGGANYNIPSQIRSRVDGIVVVNRKVVGIHINGKYYLVGGDGSVNVEGTTYTGIITDATQVYRKSSRKGNIIPVPGEFISPSPPPETPSTPPAPEAAPEETEAPPYHSEAALRSIDGKKVWGTETCFPAAAGATPDCYFQAKDGTVYKKDDKGGYTPSKEDIIQKIKDAIKIECTKDGKVDEDCRTQKYKEVGQHGAFANFMAEQREFTFQEGIELGSNLWALGTKFKLWSEADNPMAQLNTFFTESKAGLWLSGEWEKSICWQTTDFNNPNDGIAFVPGTMNVGAWVAGEYVEYRHPSLADPNNIVTDYIYRITSTVNPSGLTVHSGSENCLDYMQFQYAMDGHAIDLDMDGKTIDDVIRLTCDSKPYSLSEQNALVRYSRTLYGIVCIQFQPLYLKPNFYSNLDAGRLCAPIVPSGYEYGTGCQWCPGLFTAQAGLANSGLGYGTGYGYGASPQENRPGVSNPGSAPS